MDPAAVRERAASLPAEPGVYLFETPDVVLYIGKAVDIADRVRSYADPRSERIRKMVAQADTIDYAITDTETQALLLEANLIKRHQPTYNVRLKDDKSYPLLQLTQHPIPRIEVTRDPDEGATVFGPYTDKGRLDTVVKSIRRVFGLRGCSDHKYEGRDRPCLDYELGLCTAPCTGQISEEEYQNAVDSVITFFEGSPETLIKPLERRMEETAESKQYELAAGFRDGVQAAKELHGTGDHVVDSFSQPEREIDVLGAALEGDQAIVARLHSAEGKLVDRERHILDAPDDEDRIAAVLAAFLPQFYAERTLPDAILLPEHHGDSDVEEWLEQEGTAVRVPGAGREATLVNLALKNARRRIGEDDPIALLGERLGVPRPDRIEGFDVSHSGGTAVVGSNVSFVNGSPNTAEYRRKKLEETNDDFANMRQLILWRASRAIEGRDSRPDPDLLLIDGGKGQLRAAKEALDEIGWGIPVIALAKEHERVITDSGSFNWADDDPALHVLQRIRDESHRFAVQYHQTLRDSVDTPLDNIHGIGPALRTRLLRRFGSIDAIRASSSAELEQVQGLGPQTIQEIQRSL